MRTHSESASPRVTIVMPAYNRADLIAASIESGLAQTYRDFELLVVDDGSTDATCEVVRSFRDPRVRLLAREHRGMSAAMNAGVRAARGEYYARLDSDDLWDRRFLEVTVAVLDAKPEVGVVYPRARTFSERAGVGQADRGRPLTFPGRPFLSMLVGDHASVAALARVSCHQRVGGYDESLMAWEDWDFWVRVSREYDFCFVDEPLAYLRVHANSVTNDRVPDVWLLRRRVLDKVFEGGPLPDEIARVRPLAYRNVFFEIGCAYHRRGLHAEGARWLARGVRISGRPLHATSRALYLLGLMQGGRVPYFWRLHEALSRMRHRTPRAS